MPRHLPLRPYTVKRWKPGASLCGDGSPWKRDEPRAPAVTGTLPPGRWPANVLFSHAPGCDNDKSCVLGCPVAELRAQAGIRPIRGQSRTPELGHVPHRLQSVRRRSCMHPRPRRRDWRRRPVLPRLPLPAQGRPRRTPDTARHHPLHRQAAGAGALARPPHHPTQRSGARPVRQDRTTLHACVLEGMHGIGIERDKSYAALCAHRLRPAAQTATPARPPAPNHRHGEAS
jgi:hypothetical protein